MATTSVSIEQYLATDYERACELVGGELAEKPLGTLEHMNLERRLLRLLEPFEVAGIGGAMHELSMAIGADVRIPDVVFYPQDARFVNGLLVGPALLCVEIISPSQRLSELFAKCEAYHAGGVPYCWVIDPLSGSCWEYHAGQPVRSVMPEDFLVAGPLKVRVGELLQSRSLD